MARNVGVNLIPYDLTPGWVALIEWSKAHPYTQITISIGDAGAPTHIITPTEDGIGVRSVVISELQKKLGKPPR